METHIVWQQDKVTRISRLLTEEQASAIEAKLDNLGHQHKRIKKIPGTKTLQKYMFNGICPTPDGCKVEPDGTCPHGWDAWLKIMGVI